MCYFRILRPPHSKNTNRGKRYAEPFEAASVPYRFRAPPPSEIHEEYASSSMLDFKRLKRLKRLLVSSCYRFSSVFIMLDGLDECTTSNNLKDVIGLIRWIRSLEIKLFCTSRIKATEIQKLNRAVTIKIVPTSDDVDDYLSTRLSKDSENNEERIKI